MREVRRFSLAEVDPGRGTSRLVRDGRALDFTVEGLLLEATYTPGLLCLQP